MLNCDNHPLEMVHAVGPRWPKQSGTKYGRQLLGMEMLLCSVKHVTSVMFVAQRLWDRLCKDGRKDIWRINLFQIV